MLIHECNSFYLYLATRDEQYMISLLKIMLYGIMDLLKITIILQSNHHHINWI